MSIDNELKAVKQILKILESLNSEDCVTRVCDFVSSHLKQNLKKYTIVLSDKENESDSEKKND